MRGVIVLYKVDSCGECCVVANQFIVHRSTLIKFVYMFCNGMVDKGLSQEVRKLREDAPVQVVNSCQKPG